MQNQLIPTEELELLVSEMNNRLDALEMQVTEVIEKERVILMNEKEKEIEKVQNQCNKINEMVNRHRSQKTKQPALIIHPKYSV